jgi:hypothetical protein
MAATISVYLRTTFILAAAADIAATIETCVLVYGNHIDTGYIE